MHRILTCLTIALAACAEASPPPPSEPGSRGPRASDHVDEAHHQDELASQASRIPEVSPDPAVMVPLGEAYPSYRGNDTAADHEQLAAMHRAAAASLHAEFEEACSGRRTEDISISPLRKYAIGGSNTPSGVDLLLSREAGPTTRLLADMRCHRAWMMLAPADMDTCPLDLADIRVGARASDDGIEVSITTTNAAIVPELQRRAARELELAAAVRKP